MKEKDETAYGRDFMSDDYLSDMRRQVRLVRFEQTLADMRKIASLNKVEREKYANMTGMSTADVAKLQLEASGIIDFLTIITEREMAFVLTLTAKKNKYGGFNLNEVFRTWNRCLQYFSKSNYRLHGYVFFEMKCGTHPHVHIILYENDEKTGLSKADYIKPMLQLGFAINNCKHLDAEHCDIRPVVDSPMYLVDYLLKEVTGGGDSYGHIEVLRGGRIDPATIIGKSGGKINEIGRVFERHISAAA